MVSLGQVGKTQTRVRRISRKSVKISSHCVCMLKEKVVIALRRKGASFTCTCSCECPQSLGTEIHYS